MVRLPHPALRAYVESYVGYRHLTGPGVHHGLPSGSLTVVIAFDEPVELSWAERPEARSRLWAIAAGLHNRPALIHHDGHQHGIQVELTPLGARVLLGVPAAALAREMVDLAAMLPLRYDALAAAAWPERFRLLDLTFLEALYGDRAWQVAPEVARAWQLLGASHGTVRVAGVAAEVGWSRRHLTTRFGAELGITPKQVARVFRFQHARSLMGRGDRLADVAAYAGYADQAHLTREWRELAGYTPATYLREEIPFVQDREALDPAGSAP